MKRLEGALERFSNKCPHTEKKTEYKVNQAKLEGESSNRCEVGSTNSCRLNSDRKITQVFF